MSPRLSYLPAPRPWLARLGVLAGILLGFFTLLAPLVLAAGPGDLDPGFNGDGVVTTTIGSIAIGYGVVLQADGKIVVAGDSGGSGDDIVFTLIRYIGDFSTYLPTIIKS